MWHRNECLQPQQNPTKGLTLRHIRKLKNWSSFIVLILVLLLLTFNALAQENNMNSYQQLLKQPEKIVSQLANGSINLDQIPNPHWDKDGCVACHNKKPKGKVLHLRSKKVNDTCNNCHEALTEHNDSHNYSHPVDVKASTKMKKQMNKDFRQSLKSTKGIVGCTTCHDLSIQCVPKYAQYEKLNPKFFRGGAYRNRTDICFQCHDDKSYKRLNPHEQIDDRGEIVIERCGICHRTLDGLTEAKSIEQVDFNLSEDLSKMCTGCHPWTPHPGGQFSFFKQGKDNKKHLQQLPKLLRKQYDRMQQSSDVLLPLEPKTDKIFCATCHNPHEKGVIKNTRAAAGAGSKYRLRKTNICGQCHNV